MTEKNDKQQSDAFDEMLRAALSSGLNELLPDAKEATEEPVFSDRFNQQIKEMVAQASSTGAIDNKTARAEQAQRRMTGEIIPMKDFIHYHKAIVNAAAVLLVFGLGIFFLREGGLLRSRTSASAAPAALAETEIAAEAAPAAYAETTAEAERMLGAAGEQEELSDTALTSEGTGSGNTLAGAAGVQIANPYVPADSEGALCTETGLSIHVPAELGTDFSYTVIAGDTAQIDYQSKGLATEVCYRAASLAKLADEAGTDETDQLITMLSGIYASFDESKTVQVELNGTLVTLQTAAGTDSDPAGALLSWEQNDALYTLWAEGSSVSAEAIKTEAEALIAAVD